MGLLILNHLFILENEGNETSQAGAGMRRQTAECHHCTCFPRCPVWTVLICSTFEIYTKWLWLHQMPKMSSPVSLGGHVLPFCYVVRSGYLELQDFDVSPSFWQVCPAGRQLISRPRLPSLSFLPDSTCTLSEQCQMFMFVLNDEEQKVYKKIKVIM